ncbi:hypothetical protein RhiJN_20985 [Ceratobasidium sp. AG-Ba]|nr:hypothetical protein RhiJN_20985 [Ceratobasidium sp. AG-Ba]
MSVVRVITVLEQRQELLQLREEVQELNTEIEDIHDSVRRLLSDLSQARLNVNPRLPGSIIISVIEEAIYQRLHPDSEDWDRAIFNQIRRQTFSPPPHLYRSDTSRRFRQLFPDTPLGELPPLPFQEVVNTLELQYPPPELD